MCSPHGRVRARERWPYFPTAICTAERCKIGEFYFKPLWLISVTRVTWDGEFLVDIQQEAKHTSYKETNIVFVYRGILSLSELSSGKLHVVLDVT